MGLLERIAKLSPAQRKQLELKLAQQGMELSQLLETAQTQTKIPTVKKQEIEAAEAKEYYPLASAQKRLFMIRQMYEDNLAYNMPGIMLLQGKVNRAGFMAALKALIRRHESLRTSFATLRGEPVQRIYKEVEFEIEDFLATGESGEDERKRGCWEVGKIGRKDDKTHAFPKNQELRVKSCINSFIRPFDLTRAPLLRVGLIKIEPGKHIFLVDMHHIISDGLSYNLFIKEFTALYAGKELPRSPVRYRDFVRWQERALTSGKLARQETYWLEQFSGQLPSLDMPLDYERPTSQSFAGETLRFRLPLELNRALQALGRETNTTLFMILLALYNCLFYKYTGQDDIIIGTAVAGRNRKGLEQIMGLLMETLVFRNFPQSRQTVVDLLGQVKKNTLEAFENQSYPFRELMKKVADETNLSHNPLFDAMLILHNLERLELEIEGLRFSPYESEDYPAPVQVDINLLASEDESGILLELSYASALYKRETMERFTRHFVHLVRQVAANPRARLMEIEILPEEEKRQLLEEFSTSSYQYNREQTLTGLLAMPASIVPDHLALVLESRESGLNSGMTHRQLHRYTHRLAAVLKHQGVKPGDIVGIMTGPSEEMIVGLMGILKAGAAFLPIDPKVPLARIDYMLRDSGATLLLVSGPNPFSGKKEISKPGPGEQGNPYKVIEIDMAALTGEYRAGETGREKIPLDSHSLADSLVYVIYTSGSTGKPKGVPIDQQNLLPLLLWFGAYFQLDPRSRVLQNLSYSFDFGVFEILTTFGFGCTYFIPDRSGRVDLSVYGDFILRHDIDTLHTTPTLFNHLVSTAVGTLGLRTLHFGGEALSGKLVRDTARRVHPHCMIYNGYGPTEATINTSIYAIKAGETAQLPDRQRIPIGKPTALNTIYILDTATSSQVQPIGVVGELCIGGQGLSRGYLNNPGLTAERFCLRRPGGRFLKKLPPWTPRKNVFLYSSPVTRHPSPIYHTGDLARWLPDGNIEFLGRIDFQVKVRGYRIELGEIENRLAQHEKIQQTAVILKAGAICAYFTPRGPGSVPVRQLRDFLAEKLPDYMIPAYFIPLDRVPLTSSGKVNLRDLPEPGEHVLETGHTYVGPRDEIEAQVLRVWQEVLHLEKIGVHDDFFERGGDSITANQVIARLRETHQVELSIRKFFESPFIEALAKEIKGKAGGSAAGIIRAPREGKIPLSFSQERLWFLHRLNENITSYHVPRTVRIRGKLDVPLMERTFNEIIRRHEILRTVFPTIDDQPVQQIREPFAITIPVMDLTSLQGEAQTARVSQITLAESRKPFDFETGPLLRLALLKLKEEEFLLMSTEHHFIHDGWTQGLLLKEFIAIYRAYSQGKPDPLPELPIQYADFAIWQRKQMQGDRLESHLVYWRQKLANLPAVTELPLDHPRPAVISGKGAARQMHLSAALSDSLRTRGKEMGVTLFITMLTAFNVLLYRYTGSEDLCVGAGMANRRYKEIETLMGMVINTLPLRTQIPGHLTFDQCLQRVRTTCIEAYEHEDTPFEKIVEALQPERTLGYTPLFQVLFSFMDTPTAHLSLPGLEIQAEPTHNRSAKFDLNVVVLPPPEEMAAEIGSEIYIEWEYNTDIFDDATMDRMIRHYLRLLELIPEQAGEPVFALPLLEEKEIRQLVTEWNDTAREYPRDKTLQQLFAGQVQQTPDHSALVGLNLQIANYKQNGALRENLNACGEAHLTYKELNEKAGRLAYGLKEKGVRPDTIVSIKGERSLETITAVLAILKAGGAYLPINPDYPPERIDFMLKDSNANILITANEIASISLEDTSSHLHLSPWVNAPATSLAYIIYTSGTTGKPKAVMVEHRNVIRLVKNTDYIEFRSGDRVLQTGALEFDASTFEIWGALLNGLELHLVDQAVILAPEKLKQTLHRHQITTMWLTSSLFNQVLEQDIDIFSRLKNLLVGGDILSLPHINRLRETFPALNIIDGYGPTENTTFSTTYLVRRQHRQSIPIGKPIANSTVFIIDRFRQLVPIGVIGELWVGGAGVARGYLNHPELTAEKFDHNKKLLRGVQGGGFLEKNPPGSRKLYKTGDLARWLPDGNIEFIGRTDRQVKIRGFRVELAGIENRLIDHPHIKEAVVTAITDNTGGKQLAAYIVCKETHDITGLRKFLEKRLPAYMIPSFFVTLEQIPLTPNGKVDRNALPTPGKTGLKEYTAPSTGIQKQLTGIWSAILGIEKEKIGIDDNFFELGGHSLSATRMISNLHKEIKVKVPLAELFLHPTVRELAAYTRDSEQSRFAGLEPVEKREYYPLSPAQKRLYILQQMELSGTAYNITQLVPLPAEISVEKLPGVFQALIRRHESLRTSFLAVDGQPRQKIHDNVQFNIESYNLTTETNGRKTGNRFVQPFDLTQVPLLRVGIIETGQENRLLFIDMHHITADGTSLARLTAEFNALIAGKRLSPLKLQYRDFSGWRNRLLETGAMINQEKYWSTLLAGEIPVLDLPYDYPRPVTRSFAGSRLNFQLDHRQTRLLKEIARETGATLYMILLSLYTILLAKLSGQEDIIVGTPIAARRHADLEPIIGMFVNTLAMRNEVAPAMTFKELLNQVKERTLQAFENQEYPFEDLVDHLAVPRDTSRNPIFDVMFNLLNQAEPGVFVPQDDEPGSSLAPYRDRFLPQTAKFDLNLTAIEMAEGKGLFFNLEYCSQLFKPETPERINGFFQQIVSRLCMGAEAGTSLKLADLEMLTPEEKEKILEMSVGAGEIGEPHQTVHCRFENQAAKTPDRVALLGACEAFYRGTHLSYHQLDHSSARLASRLREKAMAPGHLVGLMVEPSVEMITGMLAILRAGGAYLPIDPKLPEKRKRLITRESALRLMLVNYPLENPASLGDSSIEIMDLRDRGLYAGASSPLHPPGQAADLAYVIYTSGSTGIPKGVMVEHGNLVNLLEFHHRSTNLDCTRVTQFASIGFDASFHEIFSTLLAGGTLFILAKDVRTDIPELCRIIRENFIKTVFLPISLLKTIFSEESWAGLFPGTVKHIQTAGEQVVISARFQHYLKQNKVWLHNHYGPSETHVVATLALDPAGEIPGLPSIGKPISHTYIFILDSAMHLQPVGIAGELYAGGAAVGRGYLNNPELTAERFCLRRPGGALFKKTAPPGPPGKNFLLKTNKKKFYNLTLNTQHLTLYKTGDLARWLPEGNIEFLGRIDFQVKLRGFRVEMGEIENRLAGHPDIKEAVVTARQDDSGGTYLCAYLVSEKKLAVTGIREFLAKQLPDYMIPAYFVTLEKLPVTPSGKIDRKALPTPGIKTGTNYAAPSNSIEMKLQEIWTEILSKGLRSAAAHHRPIGIDDNFFEWGGHSLKATILVAKIHRELEIKIPLPEVFKCKTIRRMARYIAEKGATAYAPIEPVEKKEYHPLSPAQKRLFILQQLEPDITWYNLPAVMTLEGRLHREKLARIFKKLVCRHESFRTSFEIIAGEPVQRIHAAVDFEIAYDDLTTSNTGEDKKKIVRVRPFDLSRTPLLRVQLVRTGRDRHILAVDMHHIVSDGTANALFIKDFLVLYEGKELPVLNLQYKDYAQWQRSEKEQEAVKKQEKYWRQEFQGEIPVLNLPYDYPRPEIQSFAGAHLAFELNPGETTGLKELALAQEATLFMVLLSLFNILVSKWSGQEDIVVGTPIAGRQHPDLENIIGMFVNTLALRNFPHRQMSYREFLKNLKERTLAAFENQDYQFEDLVEQVVENRDPGRNPLFDVMFALDNIAVEGSDIPNAEISGLRVKPYPQENKTAKFDISLFANERGNQLVFAMEYCTRLFEPGTLSRFVDGFKNILRSILKAPGQELAEIEILSEQEKNQVLLEFNDTRSDYPRESTLQRLFSEQAARTPDAVAVVHHHRHLSYCHLNEKAAQLAGVLKQKGVKGDDIVAIMANHSLEMVIGVVGTVQAGAAYLPVNPDYPPKRKKYLLADSQTRILLAKQRDSSDWGPGIEVIELDNPAIYRESQEPVEPGAFNPLAYVLYTSGSTGKPKGIMVEHRSAIRLVKGTNYCQLQEGTRLLQTSDLGFDVSTFETWGVLLNGARLHLLEKEIIIDAGQFKTVIRKYGIEILWLTSPLFNHLLQIDIEIFAGLKELLVGGETLSPTHINQARRRFPGLKIINGYGPTENTTFSTTYLIDKEHKRNIPIGKPIANSSAYIVDPAHKLLPPGIPGELIVGGDGVARGYLNNPELTHERFDHDEKNKRFCGGSRGAVFSKSAPLAAGGKKIYRTGDRARWLPEGNIEFLGRLDFQVKIRGYRIELEEIENCLLHHPHIEEAVVLTREDSSAGKQLGAYLVCKRQPPPTDLELKEFLAAALPPYMIPSFFVTLDKIPLTANGKIHRHALPTPGMTPDRAMIPPTNRTEEKLVEIWSGVLNLKRESIGINDSFFRLGGHSLNATIMAARIHREFQVKIPLGQIFKTPTIRGTAKYLGKTGRSDFISIVPAEKKDYYPLSSAQQQFYVIQQLDPRSMTYNMPSIQKVEGIVEREKLETAFHCLIQRHETLRTSFTVINQEAVQRVHDRVEFEVQYYDSATGGKGRKIGSGEAGKLGKEGPFEPESRELRAKSYIENFLRPFDLAQAPLLRVGLVELQQNSYILMVDMHHILSDFLSQEILIKEFVARYLGGPLETLKLQYKDYALWRNRLVLSGEMKKQEEFWLNQFKDGAPAADIPLDFPRPPVRTFAGGSLAFDPDRRETRELIALARAENVTLFMLFLAAANVLVHSLSGQKDITIGTVVAGRRHPDLDKIIGAFINTLVLRNSPNPGQTFREFLREVKERTLETFENQDYQFEELVRTVKVKRDPTRNPLFDVMFSFNPGNPTAGTSREDQARIHENAPDIKVGPYNQQGGNAAKFDLILTGSNRGEQCRFFFSYGSELFKRETIERYALYFQEILSAVAADADILLKHINLRTGLQKVVSDAYTETSEFQF